MNCIDVCARLSSHTRGLGRNIGGSINASRLVVRYDFVKERSPHNSVSIYEGSRSEIWWYLSYYQSDKAMKSVK